MTGIAGLTLGGGLGWLNGKYGLACDNLLAADVVTANGRLLTASPAEHDDLFWAIRGGGGNFGVVTSFTYRLHPVGTVLGGGVTYPPARAREALRFYHEFASTCPDELSTAASLGLAEDGRPVVSVAACYCGPIEDGERVLRPLRAFGPPSADGIQPMPYLALQSGSDAGFPFGRQHYWKSSYLQDLSDDAVEVLLRFVAEKPSPISGVGLQQMCGAASRVDPAATAFPHRHAPYAVLALADWIDPAAESLNVAWARSVLAVVSSQRAGTYVNGSIEDSLADVFGVNQARLAAVKTAYDPDNMFHGNVNIEPR